MSKTQVRKKGFSFLSFFLGFLFAIIVIVGAVAGVVIFALSTDIDTLLSTFGVDNSKDEDGNNKVVNTDPENGGVTSVMELITAVSALATDYENKSISDVEKLLPVTTSLVDTVYDLVNQYVNIDKEEMKAVKFSEFGTYIQDIVYEIEPASFVDPGDNALIETLLCGVNSDYVTASGVKYPVWYDDAGVYFYCAGENSYFVVDKSEDAYTATTTVYSYSESTAHCTGNFYYQNADETGEKIVVSPITIGSYINGGDILEPLNKLKITEFITSEEGGVADKVLGDVSVGDLIGGDFNLDDKINNLTISDFVDVAGNKILSAIGDCTLATIPDRMETLKICEIVDTEGNSVLEAIAECTLSEVPEKIESLTIGELVEVGDNKILIAIKDCTLSQIPDRMETLTIGEMVEVGDNKILAAIKDCTLATIPERMETLKIGEIVDTNGNKILEAIADSTLSEVPTKIESLTIGELIDNTDSNAILKAIAGCTLSEVPAKIDTLTVADLVGDTSGNKLLDALKDSKLTELNSAINNLSVNKLYGEYDESGNPKGIWKLLLCTREASGTYVENQYTINQFGDLTANITENMKTATLFELHDAGILTFEDASTLTKTMPNGNQLGTFTITGALEALSAYLPD